MSARGEAQLAQALRENSAREHEAAAAPVENDGDDLAGLSAGQARSSDVDAFPQVFSHLPSNPLDLSPSATLDHWVGSTAAVITDEGRRALVESMTPARVQDGGQLEPVDLDVIADGGGFAPVRPVSATRFPDAASGDFVFGEGLTASLAGASSTSHGSMAGSQVFYPSAYRDTDLAVAPSPIGVETLLIARSAQSPQQYRLRLSIPDGAVLSAPLAADGTVQGTVLIVEGDRVIGSVPPPAAADANGAAQPVSFRIDGNDLLLEAPRGPDVAYPELIDPNTQDNQFSSESDVNGHLIDAVGWTQQGTMPNGFTFAPSAPNNGHLGQGSYGTNCTLGSRTIGNSLCVSTKSGMAYTGSSGQHNDWDFFPPSGADPATRSAGDSYVYRFDARTAFYGTGGTYQYGGLYRGAVNPAFVGSGQDFVSDTGTNGSWTSTPYVAQTNSGSSSGLRRYCLTTACAPDGTGVVTNASSRAFFGTIASGTNVNGVTSLMGAATYQSDATPPGGDGSAPTNAAYTQGATPAWDESAWYRGGSTSLKIKAKDAGMGVYAVHALYTATTGAVSDIKAMTPAGQPVAQNDPTACTGTRQRPCPATGTYSPTIDITKLPEGTNRIQPGATDVLGKGASITNGLTLQVDRSAPATPTELTASLWEGTATVSWNPSDDPVLGDGTVGSGVARYDYRYRVNGTGGWFVGTSTTNSFDVSGRIDSDTLDVEITAVDGAGNPSLVGAKSGLHVAYVPRAGDGVSPDDEPFTASDDNDYGTEDCEAYFGAGSVYCVDPDASQSAERASASSGLIYGIADEDSAKAKNLVDGSYLDDPAFKALHVAKVRRIVPWDLMALDSDGVNFKYGVRVSKFRDWYVKAVNDGKDISVSFEFGCAASNAGDGPVNCDHAGSETENPPSKNSYMAATRRFKRVFTMVRNISAWNEPNGGNQPLNLENVYQSGSKEGDVKGGPVRAALYTYVLERYVCAPFRRSGKGQCNVIAGDFIQGPTRSEFGYLTPYLKALSDQFAGTPSGVTLNPVTRFSIHPYTDIDAGPGPEFSSTAIATLLNRLPVSMKVWFLEAGSRLDPRGGKPPKTPTEQRDEVAYLTDTLANDDRIDRVYYYSFCPEQGANSGSGFDSGLYAKVPVDAPRGAYCTSSSSARPAYAIYANRTNR